MASFNKVLLMGNLTRDPQLRYLPTQTPVVEFGLGMNRRWKTPQGEDRDEATFVECAAFGKTAEMINQYFQKGKAIFIEGRLKYDTWEDKQGGGKRNKLSVVVDSFQFIGARDPNASPQSAAPDQAQRPARPPPRQQPAPPSDAQPQPPIGEEQHFKEDDIPF